MYELITALRNRTHKLLDKNILQPVLFQIDPEIIHDRMVTIGQFLGKFYVLRQITSLFFNYSNKNLEQEILGIKFNNPVGLGAGFDKNAQLTQILPSLGFGFAEVGSITGKPCKGNPKPRLWRLKKSKSLLVYYGLKNDGSDAISKKLKKLRLEIPIGINIAKTNSKDTVKVDAGIRDYAKAFKKFISIGAYFTINISCPNAYGGQPFTDSVKLEKLLTRIDKIYTNKPIFLKLSPDLTNNDVDKILEVSEKHRVNGFICANLTKNRNNSRIKDSIISKEGGVSGKVVEDLSNDLISYVYKKTCVSHAQNKKTNGKFVIIGLGGVFKAEDAYKKIKLGASLVQLITGMIYESPQVISEINQGLVKLLVKDGYSNISQAIGADNK